MALTCERIEEILNRAKNMSIAVLGDLMVDVYLIGSANRMSQEAPSSPTAAEQPKKCAS